MRDKKMKYFLCGLALSGLLSGCRTQADGLVLVGESSAPQPEIAAETEEPSRIYVYVCGAVNCPGVVALPEGSRAEAALEAAGGLREDAKAEWVNLAARVADGDRLYFPTVEETEEAEAGEEDDGLVNINTADEAALCTLSGIGESRARDILRYREENGPFKTGEDIMKVPGIKTSVYNRIKDRIKTE